MERASWKGKLWCVLDAKGKPMLYTVAATRACSLVRYEDEAFHAGLTFWAWETNRRRLGLRCVPFIADLQEKAWLPP